MHRDHYISVLRSFLPETSRSQFLPLHRCLRLQVHDTLVFGSLSTTEILDPFRSLGAEGPRGLARSARL